MVTLTFGLLTLKVVSESRVTWATSVPILVFLGLSVLDLGPIYATDRRQTETSDSIIALCPRLRGAGHDNDSENSRVRAVRRNCRVLKCPDRAERHY